MFLGLSGIRLTQNKTVTALLVSNLPAVPWSRAFADLRCLLRVFHENELAADSAQHWPQRYATEPLDLLVTEQLSSMADGQTG